jgi:hypothetical protein
MLTVSGLPAQITADLDPDVLSAARAARVHVIAILTNYAVQHWDTDSVEGLLQADRGVQDAFGDKLTETLQNMGASGVMLDWQQIDPAFSGRLVEFLRNLRLKLRKDNYELWLSIPVGEDLRAFDLEDLPDVVDHLVAQLHDENGEDDAPGPVASQPWFEGWLRTLMGYGEPNQWILSLGGALATPQRVPSILETSAGRTTTGHTATSVSPRPRNRSMPIAMGSRTASGWNNHSIARRCLHARSRTARIRNDLATVPAPRYRPRA